MIEIIGITFLMLVAIFVCILAVAIILTGKKIDMSDEQRMKIMMKVNRK